MTYYDYMAQHPEADLKIACLAETADSVAIPLRKGEETKALREAIDKAITELAEDGTLSQLAVKYFGTDISKAD